MKYVVIVKPEVGSTGGQLLYSIDADNPNTALQVAAARARSTRKHVIRDVIKDEDAT